MARRIKDPTSGFSHLFGALLSVAGLIVLLTIAIGARNPRLIVGYTVFGISLILLYSASTVYHLVNASERIQVALRKLDHVMIFVLIAGTYTPVCLVALRGTAGYVWLAVIWCLAFAGLFFRVFCLNAPRWLYTAVYLIMGWISVFVIVPVARAVGGYALAWMITGGLFYSTGAIIYILKRPNPIPGWLGFHEIFHILILLGSMSHFYFIYLLA